MRLKQLCGAVIAIVLVLAGCGGSTSKSSGGSTAATRPAVQSVVRFTNRYPPPKNPGPHPGARIDHLIVRDVHRGTGPVIHAGDTGQFEFIATNYTTGRQIESSWHRFRRPFESKIEHNVVIDGWWQGIPGMRVGGERQITIPPALGFTSNPTLSGATTYFDVVLTEVLPEQPRGLAGGEGQGQSSSG